MSVIGGALWKTITLGTEYWPGVCLSFYIALFLGLMCAFEF